MADGSKVHLGVCDVIFDGDDLGYTKGGVTLTVETQVHEILVDQEGPAPIGAVIMGRKCTVEIPMAETDYDRLQALMPGSAMNGNRLDISSGTGQDLMTLAAVCTLHPHGLAANNHTMDINIWKASPVANLRFTMTPDGEWVYPVQMTGFVSGSADTYPGVILSFGAVS